MEGSLVVGNCVEGNCVVENCVEGNCVVGDCVVGDCVVGDCVVGDCVVENCVEERTWHSSLDFQLESLAQSSLFSEFRFLYTSIVVTNSLMIKSIDLTTK